MYCLSSFNLNRKIIQINDLVIDNTDMLVAAEHTKSLKVTTTPYTNGHGSYAPAKRKEPFFEEQALPISIQLDTRKLRSSNVAFYKDFAYQQLLKIGRVWAIEGDKILWAFCRTRNISEPYSLNRYSIQIDLELLLWEGIWHIADPLKTFLEPYETCNYDECLDLRSEESCMDCCATCQQPLDSLCQSCMYGCSALDKDFAVCAMRKEAMDAYYNRCGAGYRIVYNCEAAKEFWPERYQGHKFCKEDICRSIIAGQFYSHTILETENWTIHLTGLWRNPEITINGNTMILDGDWEGGTLILKGNGDISYRMSDDCCTGLEEEIPPDVLIVPPNNTFGFDIRPGLNSIVVAGGECCSMGCVYIKEDAITY